jgi:uncharacterized protein involved in type VI secretion and phage assembly
VNLERIVADLAEKVERHFYGKYRGFVVDNQDPAQLGRLKVRVPSVLGSDVVTGWAMPCVPYGGSADQGFLFIPERDAGVWVEFEEGDLEFPIWVGTFWSAPNSESELPKPNQADGSEESSVQDPPTRKIIKTLKGHTLQFEDADGSEMITLIDGANGHVITLNADGIKATDGKNGHAITLDGAGITVEDGKNSGNKVTMAASGVTVEDTNGNKITMDQSGTVVEDKNQNKIEMSAASINILPAVMCKLGSGAVNMVNNLPACLFTGALHAMDTKGHATVMK